MLAAARQVILIDYSQFVSDDAASIDSEFSQPEVCCQVYYSERSITSCVDQTISNQKSD